MIRQCRPTQSIVRKSYIKITRHQEDEQSKATNQDDCKTRKDTQECTTKHGKTQNSTMGSTTNQQQQNHCLRTTNPFLVICMEKQYSENVSIDAFDNNTRLKN